MNICLSTKLEISKEKEIKEVFDELFPECKVKINIKPRKCKKKKRVKQKKAKSQEQLQETNKNVIPNNKTVKKENVTRIICKKAKKERNWIPYFDGECMKDLQYNRAKQEDAIKKIVDYYREYYKDLDKYIDF